VRGTNFLASAQRQNRSSLPFTAFSGSGDSPQNGFANSTRNQDRHLDPYSYSCTSNNHRDAHLQPTYDLSARFRLKRASGVGDKILNLIGKHSATNLPLTACEGCHLAEHDGKDYITPGYTQYWLPGLGNYSSLSAGSSQSTFRSTTFPLSLLSPPGIVSHFPRHVVMNVVQTTLGMLPYPYSSPSHTGHEACVKHYNLKLKHHTSVGISMYDCDPRYVVCPT